MASAENQLIESLPRQERRGLLALANRVELVPGEPLDARGSPSRSVYFPTDGCISLVAMLGDKPVVEVGMIGREGLWGSDLAFFVASEPMRALIQGPVSAWRMSAQAFRRELAQHKALRRCVDRYICTLITQLVCSAACLGFHRIEPRLARWLLMSQDRAHSDSFFATQELLSGVLGVRRVSVTAAAGELQRRGLIQYSRGNITVVDRPGLEAASCSCYAIDRAAYGRSLAY